MCRTAEEIRSSDYTCIALDKYLDFRKKQVNGDKESLAYFDVLRTEAEIQNRIITIQTQEDVSSVKDDQGQIKRRLSATNKNIKGVEIKMDAHIKKCEGDKTMMQMRKDEPVKFWSIVSGLGLLYYVVLHIIEYSTGLGDMLKTLLSLIPGVDIK